MTSSSGFSGKTGVYSQFRPSYPQAALDYLANEAGLSGQELAEPGCGTGIFTLLAARFARFVYGVDNNADMLAASREATSACPNIKISEGTAEHTGLPGQSVDAVIAAQAFHFFDKEAFRNECRRIMRPGGKVALIWNSLLEGTLVERLGLLSGAKFRSGLLAGNPEMVAGFYPGDQYERQVIPNFQAQTREMFIGRYLSSSYAPRKGEPGYEAHLTKLNQIFDDFQKEGIFDHPYYTIIYVGAL
ncbi:SAM-dependent methyltransferase [Deltaproteobacteria bacterium Smac51]|nr:SAM-dependent methyltransferase [Deltaproteobacteria bacterium Smac51]